jgi:hypothetical protein
MYCDFAEFLHEIEGEEFGTRFGPVCENLWDDFEMFWFDLFDSPKFYTIKYLDIS